MTFRTEYDPKPSLNFSFDWSAVHEDYEPGDPIGFGVSEQDAIDDLVEQIELRDGAREDAEQARYDYETGREQ